MAFKLQPITFDITFDIDAISNMNNCEKCVLGHVLPQLSFNTLLSQNLHCLTKSKNEVPFSFNQVSFATSQWDYKTVVYDLVK